MPFLANSQCPNGGFRLELSVNDCLNNAKADPDATSFAVQGLLAAPQTSPVKSRISRAIGYLKTQQGSDGGVKGGAATETENANSTGLAVLAFDTTGNRDQATEGRLYLRSLSYTCDFPADMRGAIAYDKPRFATADGPGQHRRADRPGPALHGAGHAGLRPGAAVQGHERRREAERPRLHMLRRVLVALLLAVPLVATGGTAQAASCAADQVTVVVQYLGGAQVTRCTSGDPKTGIEALTSAGFSYTFAPRNPGFVCTINGNPGNRNCMKPKYWAYWHAAQPGGAWTYSSEGAGTYDPAPGTVEGWRFDCGAAPGAGTKCAASAPKPSPQPKPTPAPSSQPPAGTSATAGASGSPAADARAKKSARATAKASAQAKAKVKARVKKKKAAAAAASASATPSPGSEVRNASASQSAPPSSEPERRGNLPWWWGAVVLVLIGGTAGAVTVARRR